MGKKRYQSPNEDEFVQLIEASSPAHPHIEIVQRVVIKCGPQTYIKPATFHPDEENGFLVVGKSSGTVLVFAIL